MPNVMAAQPNIGGALCKGQTSCKVWLASGEWCRSSNEAETQNTLKFAGVPQTPEPISDANGPKFAILRGQVEEGEIAV